MDALLDVSNLSISFGGVTALNDVSFSIEQGDIVSLIGPNGAGKTTVLNIITGYYTADSGKIIFEGENVCKLKPYLMRQKGIARTFQKSELFPSMTVRENVMMGLCGEMKANLFFVGLGLRKAKTEEEGTKEKANEVLAFIGLSNVADLKASELPLGLRKILELGRAVAIPPKLLLLDEPVAGLNETEILNIENMFYKIREEFGVTILIVEHDMNFVMKISEKITVIDSGKKIAEGSPEEVRNNPMVIEAYLGRKR